MSEDVTPIRQQYLEIKREYPNTILFFRLGDFYETFDEDAETTARELDIVLTSRPVGKGLRAPLAGIPYHAVESYLAKLVEKGYHVAICEQVGDQPSKGIFPRKVVRVVTPGTVIEPGLLLGDCKQLPGVRRRCPTRNRRAKPKPRLHTRTSLRASLLRPNSPKHPCEPRSPGYIRPKSSIRTHRCSKTWCEGHLTPLPAWRFEPRQVRRDPAGALQDIHAGRLWAEGAELWRSERRARSSSISKETQPDSLSLLTGFRHLQPGRIHDPGCVDPSQPRNRRDVARRTQRLAARRAGRDRHADGKAADAPMGQPAAAQR